MAFLSNARFPSACFLLLVALLSMNTTCHGQLVSNYYNSSCPNVQNVVRSSMTIAVQKEPRMAASLLRLFFHDCFVQGCDASVLLDDTATLQGEKTAFPNINSLRGFEVIDTIKSNVETACPGVVSCADILALAARDGVSLSGGPSWAVLLGRRDATTASYSGANANLPGPNLDVSKLIEKFQDQGLSVNDLVTLSGAHTIGQARCTTFRQRLYNQNGNDQPDSTLNTAYLAQLQAMCPSNGSDDNISPLDTKTPTRFDSCYYNDLVNNKGLLTSDQGLYSAGNSTISIVQSYSQNPRIFFNNFKTSMIAMGNLNPLTGTNGEIRRNCRVVN